MIEQNEPSFILREGKPLCSTRNPQREALQWVERNRKVIEKSSVVAVVGVGAGFHILELIEQYGHEKFHFVDVDETVVQQFGGGRLHCLTSREDCLEFLSVLQALPSVVSFQPSWAGREKEYADICRYLLCRDAEVVDQLFDRLSLREKPGRIPSVLDLECKSGQRGPENHILGVLRELIK